MTSKQTVSAALAGQPAPRVPTGPLAVHYCAGTAGYSIRQYSTDAEILAECVIRYHERFQPDAVWISADTWVSAQAMGAHVEATGDDQPLGGAGPPRVQTARDIDRIPPPDPATQGRYPLMIEACSQVVKELGDEVFVVACFDQYPFSLAAAMMGIDQLMLKLVDDPPFVRALMERCAEYGLAYGRALSDAGADMLSGGDSPAGLIGPRAYREFALPFEQRLIASLKSATRKPVSLHICGNALPILRDMATSGADVLEIDHRVDISAALDAVPPGIALWGNLDPVQILSQGTAMEVRQAAKQVLEKVRAAKRQDFVLSSGCTLAVETPAENLVAMLNSVL